MLYTTRASWGLLSLHHGDGVFKGAPVCMRANGEPIRKRKVCSNRPNGASLANHIYPGHTYIY